MIAQPHAKPGEIVDLRPLGRRLADTKTTALIKTEHFEAIRLVVRADTEIPPHEVAGNMMLHCLEGHILLSLARSSVELSAGDWLYLEGGEIHALKGVKDSSLLLTILFDKQAI